MKHLAFAFLAIGGICSLPALAQAQRPDRADRPQRVERPVRDPAPSGRETSEMHIYRDSAITIPGRDTTVREERRGNRQIIEFDPRGNEVPGHQDDTTFVDHRRSR